MAIILKLTPFTVNVCVAGSEPDAVPVNVTVTDGAPSLVSSNRAMWVPADVGA